MLKDFLQGDANRRSALAAGEVIPEPERCVQCGICSFNCPVNIDVRAHAWRGEPVWHSRCLTCGECVRRCPRGVLHFTRSDLFTRQDRK